MSRILLGGLLALVFSTSAYAVDTSWRDRQAPVYPNPTGRVLHVGNVSQLRAAVKSAKSGDTIALADGTYRCVPWLWVKDKTNLVIRSASNDPSKVRLVGKGWEGKDHENEDIVWVDDCVNLTFAHLTFAETHAYGVKVNAGKRIGQIHVHHCHFRDIGIRGIKGTKGENSKTTFVRGGSVRYCHFENTKIPESNWQFNGDYITAIDMMRLEDWTFADNTFVNIKGRNGQARGAIFVWVDCKNLVAERNLFIGCDRGVAFGNAHNGNNADTHVRDSVCRNNMFVTDGADASVELAWCKNVLVCHNSIMVTKPGDNIRGIRIVENGKTKEVRIVNNILGAPAVLWGIEGNVAENNYLGPVKGWFVDPANGNLRLTAAAAAALQKAKVLEGVGEDFDGRARDHTPDLGANEFGAEPSKIDGPIAQSTPPATTAAKSGNNKVTSKATPATAKKTVHTEASAHAAKLASGGQTDKAKAAYEKIAAAAQEPSQKQSLQLLAQACALRPELIAQVTAGFKQQGIKPVYLDLMGERQRVRLLKANAKALEVQLKGGKLPVGWDMIGGEDLAHMATAYATNGPQHLTAAKFLAACGKHEAAAKALERARQSGGLKGDDLTTAKTLDELLRS